MAVAGWRLVREQGPAVAVGMVGGKQRFQSILPGKVTRDDPAFSQRRQKQRDNYLPYFSTPATVIFGSISPYPDSASAGAWRYVIRPQERRCNRGHRNVRGRFNAIQKNRTEPKPLVWNLRKKQTGVVDERV